jgi:hypothetical protein
MDACPDGFFIGAVKIITFLGIEPRLTNKNGFNRAGKIEHFSEVYLFFTSVLALRENTCTI